MSRLIYTYFRLSLSSINCRNEVTAAVKVVDSVLSSHGCSLLYIIRCIIAGSLYIVLVLTICTNIKFAYIIRLYKQALDTRHYIIEGDAAFKSSYLYENFPVHFIKETDIYF